jgi:hypothetical protein
MLTAISSGVSELISIPMGAWTRSNTSFDEPLFTWIAPVNAP